ncbi:MAG TPA: glycosyltransferase family 4 protein [Candidatus Solibacter sp.]|nr:glycosyltransferase family 4 protein [Candidatus Solibacter sp.]
MKIGTREGRETQADVLPHGANPSPRFHDSEIAYILKAFGRTSETFITNEIHLLETLGLPLGIFSIKQLEQQRSHATIGKIKARVTFLPATTPLTRDGSWLRANLPRFIGSHWKLLRRRPWAYLTAAAETLRMSVVYRRSAWAPLRTVFCKEFLQAGYIAQCVLDSRGSIRHLHAHFCHGTATVAMLASRLCAVPYSFTAHAKDIYLGKLNPGDLLTRKIRGATFVVTCTDANRRHLLGVCSDGAPIYTVYHGLDTELFAPVCGHPADGAGEALHILSVGRLVEKKGFDCLVRACGILRDRGYRFTCRIVGGEDVYASAIRALIAELQLGDIVAIQNSVTQEELKGIYAQSTVFALPCQVIENGDRDGIPNVLAEAMAMELPVVSTDISGIPEIVHHGVNGLLVPERDPNAMADAIETILRNPEYARRLGAAARATICEMFDSRRNTVALRALLASRLERGHK